MLSSAAGAYRSTPPRERPDTQSRLIRSILSFAHASALLAGLGYGWAFERTGRFEAAVLVHGLLNASHMLRFTYPGFAR